MVRLTDRTNMTLDVYRGRKTTTTTTLFRNLDVVTDVITLLASTHHSFIFVATFVKYLRRFESYRKDKFPS